MMSNREELTSLFFSNAKDLGLEYCSRSVLTMDEHLLRCSKDFMARRESFSLSDLKEDFTIVTTRSSLLLDTNDDFNIIDLENRANADKSRIIETINDRGRVSLLSSTTFGRKNGRSLFTVLSYSDFPLSKSLVDLPQTVDMFIDNLAIDQTTESGFIEFKYDEVAKTYKPQRQARVTPTLSDNFRKFIQGIDPVVLEYAKGLGEFDRLAAPILQEQISTHAHNAVGYHLRVRDPRDSINLLPQYHALANSWEEYFEEYGGQCVLFAMDVIEKMKKLGIMADGITYPIAASSNRQNDGHSGVLVSKEGSHYLIDTGLSIPFPIPVNDSIPLAPFDMSDNRRFLVTTQQGQIRPEILLLSKNKLRRYLVTEIIPGDLFQPRIADILSRLHTTRQVAKIDYHNDDGSSRVAFSVGADKMIITEGPNLVGEFNISTLHENDCDEILGKVCLAHSIDASKVIIQLKRFADFLLE